MSKTKAIICTNGEPLTDADLRCVEEYARFRKMRRSLENVYMLAKRERRKAVGYNAEQWDHIIRFCHEAGLKSSILRTGRGTDREGK